MLDVAAERRRQIEAEGWTPEHDDEHANGELALAATCYAAWGEGDPMPMRWPWAADWWKPKDERRNLVRAAALLLAEIERLDRNAARCAKCGGSLPVTGGTATILVRCRDALLALRLANENAPTLSQWQGRANANADAVLELLDSHLKPNVNSTTPPVR